MPLTPFDPPLSGAAPAPTPFEPNNTGVAETPRPARAVITALTGGSSQALDGQLVAYWTLGEAVFVQGATVTLWQLQAGTQATDLDAGYVRPADFHATLNPRVFVRLVLSGVAAPLLAKLSTIAGLNTANSLIALNGSGAPYALPTTDLDIRMRQGTDAERREVVFAAGEPVWTTDTKKLFVGDGTTPGGVATGGGAPEDGFVASVNGVPAFKPVEISAIGGAGIALFDSPNGDFLGEIGYSEGAWFFATSTGITAVDFDRLKRRPDVDDSPTTGGTLVLAASSGSLEASMYLTAASTISTPLEIAVPSESAIGTRLRLFTRSAVTTLTVTIPGSTVRGIALPASLPAGGWFELQKVAESTWWRTY